MTARRVAFSLALLGATLVVTFVLAASCVVAFEPRCRGDSVAAIDTTNLVRCSTLDSLAVKS